MWNVAGGCDQPARVIEGSPQLRKSVAPAWFLDEVSLRNSLQREHFPLAFPEVGHHVFVEAVGKHCTSAYQLKWDRTAR